VHTPFQIHDGRLESYNKEILLHNIEIFVQLVFGHHLHNLRQFDGFGEDEHGLDQHLQYPKEELDSCRFHQLLVGMDKYLEQFDPMGHVSPVVQAFPQMVLVPFVEEELVVVVVASSFAVVAFVLVEPCTVVGIVVVVVVVHVVGMHSFVVGMLVE
jgi:hypothetical protein